MHFESSKPILSFKTTNVLLKMKNRTLVIIKPIIFMVGSRSKVYGMCERIMWPRNTYFSNPKCCIRKLNKNWTFFDNCISRPHLKLENNFFQLRKRELGRRGRRKFAIPISLFQKHYNILISWQVYTAL